MVVDSEPLPNHSSGRGEVGLNDTVELSQESGASAEKGPPEVERRYSMIARRLAEIGDEYMASKREAVRLQTEEVDRCQSQTRSDQTGAGAVDSPSLQRLTSLEQEIVEWIRSRGDQIQNNVRYSVDRNQRRSFVERIGLDFQMPDEREFLEQLIWTSSPEQFGRIVDAATEVIDADTTKVALVFYITTAAVRSVSSSASALSSVICRFFAS